MPNPARLGNRKGAAAGRPVSISDCPAAEIPLSSGVPIRRILLKYWLPPLAWMVLIFSASADSQSYQHSAALFAPLLHWLFPQLSENRIELLHHLFRKTAHLTEYAVLALLLWRAIHHSRRPPVAPKRLVSPKSDDGRSEGGWRWDEAGLSLAIVFVYAASDEFHQVFVFSRTALVSDVCIDTAGGATGLLLLWGIGKTLKHW